MLKFSLKRGNAPAEGNKRVGRPVIPAFKGLLSILFLYAAFDKLLDISRFQLSMYKSPLLPPALIPSLSYLVPLSELLCVILLFHKKGHWGFIGSFIILCSFTLYITLLLPYPEGSICSCGALIEKMSLPYHLLFNLFFTAGAFVGMLQTDNAPQSGV